jgi:hypothetical protein
MEAAGLDPDSVVEREMLGGGDAERERFYGSPTIRVAGRDIADPGTNPIGLTCRLYRLRDGRVSALPDPGDIADALRAATEGGERR